MSAPASSLAAALDQLWQRFLPEMRARVAVLEEAARICANDRLTAAQTAEAHAIAHKLAGALGSFNLTRGTVVARQLELLYAAKDLPGAEHAPQLHQLADELRKIVETRPPSQRS